ncbi:MAG: hypothetical protein WD065_18290 [Planctomycetaceae bacterium]
MELIPIVVPSIDHQSEPMTLCNWLIDCGERIDRGEDILEISLPGIVWDVPSPVSGQLDRIARGISDRLLPGDICGWIRPDIEPPADEDRSANGRGTGSGS